MGLIAVPVPADELVQVCLVGPPVAATLEAIAADLLASLASQFEKGNLLSAELAAGPLDGLVSAILIGTDDDAGGLLTYDNVTPRFIVSTPDAPTMNLLLGRVRTEQALEAHDTLYGVDFAIAGGGTTLVYGMLWGPSLG